MATKQFYATGDFRYGTRMLRSGDGPITMDGPTARLYTALGKITPKKPRAVQLDGDDSSAVKGAPLTEQAAPAPAKPKRAPRKRAAKKAK